MRKKLRSGLIVLLVFLLYRNVYAQSPCDSITPAFIVDLTGKPNGTWVSSAVQRDGNCCGTLAPDKCIEFIITLDSNAVAINFQIASGAIPPGALFYQIGCGPQIAVGSAICLDGPGPYLLTFCKPGNNINSYAITSIGGPEVSPDDTIGNGCSTTMYASGLLQDSTINWTSVFPGASGEYNSYLSCTIDCDSVVVTPQGNPPPYIDFVVCGRPMAGPCISGLVYWCDTIRIHFTPPLIPVVTPDPAFICEEGMDSVLLSGSFTGGVAPFSFQWKDDSGLLLGTDTVLYVTEPGLYFFYVFDKNYPACPAAYTTVEVKTIKPEFNVAVENSCAGEQTQFTASPAEEFSFSWNFDDGTFGFGENAPDHLYAEAGEYTVVVTATSVAGCLSRDTIVATVFPEPHADFSATEVCFGSPTLFENETSVAAGTISSCAWDFGNFSLVNYHSSPDYVYAAPGTFAVTMTVTTENGCVASVTKPVIVYPLPEANFSSSAVCEGLPVQFASMATVQGGGELASVLWAFGDGSPVSSAQHPSHTYFVSGIYNVSLVAMSSNGCKDTITKPVVVYPSPVAKFDVPDSGSCENTCIQFSDSSGGGGIVKWNWNFGDGSPSSELENPVHCYSQSGNYAITLSVTSVNGCASSITINKIITVYPSPVADFTFTPQPATTLNPTIQFTDKSTDASGWLWNFGDGDETNSSYEENPTHFYSDTGKYCVTLSVENSFHCLDTAVRCLAIDPEFTFFIPNAFTPGKSDALNDEFSGTGTNIKEYEMWIYDRWGDMIFYTNQLNKRWNGCANEGNELVQGDVYLYVVKLVDLTGNEHKYKGKVTVIR